MRQNNLDEHLVMMLSTILSKSIAEKNTQAKWKSNRSYIISNY
jgi:hypothetical protein